MIFEKVSAPITLPSRNAFDLLKSAANSKGLPEMIANPWNQTQVQFNKILTFLKDQEVTFDKCDCDPRIKNRKVGAAAVLFMKSVTLFGELINQRNNFAAVVSGAKCQV